MALKYRRLWLVLGWAQVALIVYLSLTPHPLEPISFDHVDKIEHALAYAVPSFWFCQIYRTAIGRVCVLLVGLGIGLEYVQGWTGYRTFDVFDMQADGAGVFFGWLLALTPMGRLLSSFENYVANKLELK